MMSRLHIVNIEATIRRDDRYLVVIRGDGEEHAAGTLSLVGGTIEPADEQHNNGIDVLETTLKREIREEVNVEVENLRYVYSVYFETDHGEPVIDIVYVCDWVSGEPHITDPDEVGEILWLTAEEIYAHQKCPPWTRRSLERIEKFLRQ